LERRDNPGIKALSGNKKAESGCKKENYIRVEKETRYHYQGWGGAPNQGCK
jgi:hypothetical protein